MTALSGFWLRNARWPHLLAAFAVLALYCLWAFGPSGPFMRALKAAGGRLAEMQPGFPRVEPGRTLEALSAANAIPDYICFQAVDIPYAILNYLVFSLAIALGLRAIGREQSSFRLFLCAPLIYLACEFLEDGLLAGFAAGQIAPVESVVLLQQTVTTLKLASVCVSALATVILLVAALLRQRSGRSGSAS